MAQTHIASNDAVTVKVTSAGGKRNATSGSRGKKMAAPKKPPGRRYARNERTTKGTYTSRRYGPDNADFSDIPVDEIGISSAYTNFDKMDDKQLSQFAIKNWNHRFPDGEPRDNMLAEIQRRMDTRRHARYA